MLCSLIHVMQISVLKCISQFAVVDHRQVSGVSTISYANRHQVDLRSTRLSTTSSQAFSFAGIPTMKESSGLLCTDGKRPDCLSIYWLYGKLVAWNVTTLAESYINT